MVQVLQKAFIQVKKGENEYILACNNNANLGEAFDAVQEISSYIVQRIQEHQKSNERPAEEAPKEV